MGDAEKQEAEDHSSMNASETDTRTQLSKDISDTFGLRETRAVRRLRLVVFGILLISLVLVSFGIYRLTRNTEEKDLDRHFESQAQKIIDSFHYNVEQKLGSLNSLSVAITSHALMHNSEWPEVTLPSFHILGADTRALSSSVSLAFFPLVKEADRSRWELFTQANRGWIDEGLEFEKQYSTADRRSLQGVDPSEVSDFIFNIDGNGQNVRAPGPGPFFAQWETSPVVTGAVNYDLWSDSAFKAGIDKMVQTNLAVVGKVTDLSDANEYFERNRPFWENDPHYFGLDPVTKWFFPVFDTLDTAQRKIVGMLTAIVYWESYLSGVLPQGSPAIDVVLTSECDETMSYTVIGEKVEYKGKGDLHDTSFSSKVQTSDIFLVEALQESVKKYQGVSLTDVCQFQVNVYPTSEVSDEYISNRPWVFVGLIVGIFLLTIFVIMFYDYQVERRQRMTLQKAEKAGEIIKSIFPANVRARLYDSNGKDGGGTAAYLQEPQKQKIKSFLNENPEAMNVAALKSMSKGSANGPIADNFPETTILFADIVGFSAWSSEREPQQVFTLLQTLYADFDALAKKHGVFKVETIGDCYVAATGLPEPQVDHAVRMVKFASKCMIKMNEITRSFDTTLGPDTGELRMRVGLHSGPVAAGVLKGEKTRFQLFGDTVNTASRMESTGKQSRIHCSESTARALKKMDKSHWVRKREDIIQVKGKGLVQTYWIVPKSELGEEDADKFEQEVELDEERPIQAFDLSIQSDRQQRLIDWIVEVMTVLLKQIAAQRLDSGVSTTGEKASIRLRQGSTALDEVTEIIRLPDFQESRKSKTDPMTIILDHTVFCELKDYVTTIASMYQPNAFHNFEHASHVTQSTSKLLKRIVLSDAAALSGEQPISAEEMHNYSHGLATDCLAQFTLVLCALIHDVDHPGVSNFQLIAEQSMLARYYKNKSIAEQNSVDIAWDLLMDDRYKNLRGAIYNTEAELKRFRQLMVNIVLATDIFDKDMKAIRESRWAKAFSEDADGDVVSREGEKVLSEIDGINLRATIVIEHLIQASDVSHTMQHFSIYMKWNERLFQEMYSAYEAGRSSKDPSPGWYKGELWFFDNYVIPLARKLDQCGCFGAHSQEYLNYALQNRKRFAIEGEEASALFLERYKEQKEKDEKAKAQAAAK